MTFWSNAICFLFGQHSTGVLGWRWSQFHVTCLWYKLYNYNNFHFNINYCNFLSNQTTYLGIFVALLGCCADVDYGVLLIPDYKVFVKMGGVKLDKIYSTSNKNGSYAFRPCYLSIFHQNSPLVHLH